MKINTNPVKGTRDFLPMDVEIRDYVQNTILEVYKKHGFTRIQTPVLESADILLGSEGGENLKMIYKILKRGQKLNLQKEDLKENDLVDMGLRYDLTLPLSRFYANNHSKLPAQFKSIQIGEVFRAERPQKGRFRSFVQCDIDVIGDESYGAELELISTTAEALTKLDFQEFKIRINDRRVLKAMIEGSGFPSEDVGKICIIVDKLDKIGLDGVQKELLENEYDNEVVDKFLKTLNDLSGDGYDLEQLTEIGVEEQVVASLKTVLAVVSAQEGSFSIVFDPSLVRGMGYYTGMIFEIEYTGFGVSIAGGGRYDKMIGKFMKNDVPAVGFSIGFERIISILSERGFQIPEKQEKMALLFDLKEDDVSGVYKYADKCREEGTVVSIIQKHKKLGKQIDKLKNEGFTSFAVYRSEEDEITIKEI